MGPSRARRSPRFEARRFLAGAALLAGLSASPRPASAGLPFAEGTADRAGLHWDAELQGGYALLGQTADNDLFFVRGHGGVLFGHEPWFGTAGVFAQGSGLSPWSVGAQLGLVHVLAGTWLQLGLGVDEQADTTAHFAGGWALLGVEGQVRLSGAPPSGRPREALFFTLRVPVGFFFAFR